MAATVAPQPPQSVSLPGGLHLLPVRCGLTLGILNGLPRSRQAVEHAADHAGQTVYLSLLRVVVSLVSAASAPELR